MLPCTWCCVGPAGSSRADGTELNVADVACEKHGRCLRPAISDSPWYPQLPACFCSSLFIFASCYRPAPTSPQAPGCLSPLPTAQLCLWI